MHVKNAFRVECCSAFGVVGDIKKRGNPKVNEFDESISCMIDFHVNEMLVAGGVFISQWPPGGLNSTCF